jgi:DNA-binding MarR family transcriptional regulator
MGIRQPTASQVVKALAAPHLVTVRADKLDCCAARVHATSEGQAIVRKLTSSFCFGDRLPLALGLLECGELNRRQSGLAELLDALPPASGARTSGGRSDSP